MKERTSLLERTVHCAVSQLGGGELVQFSWSAIALVADLARRGITSQEVTGKGNQLVSLWLLGGVPLQTPGSTGTTTKGTSLPM